MNTKYDLVIFDCDGVLIDSEPLSSRTLSQALISAGLDYPIQRVMTEITGKSESQIVDIICAAGVADPAALLSRWHRTLYTAFKNELQMVAGLYDLIAGLEAPICVASNSTRDRLERSLGLTPLWHHFAPHIYSGADMAHPKPAPDLIEHCLTTMSATAAHSIMIDDSPSGIQAAVAAGVPAIGFVTPGETRPDSQQTLLDAGAIAIAHDAISLDQILTSHAPAR